MSVVCPRSVKRKKRRSFLQKQVRFGKQGRYGRGANLDPDMYQYFLKIMEAMKGAEGNTEEMEMLSSSVFEEITDREIEYGGNQLASRVIENLLPFASDEKLCDLIDKFTDNLRPIVSDPYISHILERIVALATEKYLKYEYGDTDDNKGKCRKSYLNCVLKMSRFCLNNLEDFVWDTYANHVVRTVLTCLNSGPVKAEKTSVSQFSCILEEFTNRLLSWPQFNELTREELTSGLVQSLLVNTKQCSKLSKKIVKKVCNGLSGEDLISDNNQAALRLLETVLTVVNEKYYIKVYEKCFKGKLCELAKSKICNFAVQKLINQCPNKELFEEIFNSLSDIWVDLLAAKHSGVLLALSQGCHKHKSKQGQFYNLLTKLLDCQEPEEKSLKLVQLGCSLVPHEKYVEGSTKINLHGCLIVQEMLQYNKPIRLVTSILNMPLSVLKELLCDPRGCHVTDVFVQSPYIGEKSCEKLLKKLEGQYCNLALSKHGSRSFDALWTTASIKQKSSIMEELLAKQSEVMSSQFGRVIAYKVRLNYFRQNKKAWGKHSAHVSSKDKFLSEIEPSKKKIKLENS